MNTFRLRYEFYNQIFTYIDVEAKDFAEAIEIANSLDPDEHDDADFRDDFESSSTRLYSIMDMEDDESYAVINVPDIIAQNSWVNIDLRNQLKNCGKKPPDKSAEIMFEKVVMRYMSNLSPTMGGNAPFCGPLPKEMAEAAIGE